MILRRYYGLFFGYARPAWLGIANHLALFKRLQSAPRDMRVLSLAATCLLGG